MPLIVEKVNMHDEIRVWRFVSIPYRMHKEEIERFFFGFPDVWAALQQAQGRLTPWAIVDLWLEMQRTSGIALNGAGILPDFHGMGGNAPL